VELIPIDGSQGEGGGQLLRTALALSLATEQGFRIENIRARRARPGLRPQHVAAVHAAAMACGGRVGGCFEGSPDLRFEPGPLSPGRFNHEIGTAGAVSLVLQAVLPPLACATAPSAVSVTGGTHVPRSPSYEFLASHWAPVVARTGLDIRLALGRAGYLPPGGGEAVGSTGPRPPDTTRLDLEWRGSLVSVRALAGGTRTRLDAARAACGAAVQVLWERRRLEIVRDVSEHKAASPGWFLQLEAVFENGRAAFGCLPERPTPPERAGSRVARDLLAFLDRDEAVDPWLADQLLVPVALSGAGGVVTTPEVTSHLETAAATIGQFGIPVRVLGRRGLAGGFEIGLG
jgi:RNA 3'-terminal phosphate cyclase (ATP)